MKELFGRTAVVTGAASGIGRALALRAAEEGMAVALADVDTGGLEETRRQAESRGAKVIAVPTDVSKREAVEALAAAARQAFGGIHLVCNNAGVLVSGRSWECSQADWEWVLGVNLWGVIHGVRVFVPILIEQGEPAHIVNTASVGGLTVGPYLAAYIASKHAVLALTESLHYELAASGAPIGVSALCPGAVATGIARSERVRPGELAPAERTPSEADAAFSAGLDATVAAGMSPADVAGHVFDAVREGRFWILPDPSFAPGLEARTRSALQGLNPLQGLLPADAPDESRAGAPSDAGRDPG